jgi:hypothetical protein
MQSRNDDSVVIALSRWFWPTSMTDQPLDRHFYPAALTAKVTEVLARVSVSCYFSPGPGRTLMRHMVAEFALSEDRSSELEIIRGKVSPMRTATGFAIAGMASALFWGVVGLTAWLII